MLCIYMWYSIYMWYDMYICGMLYIYVCYVLASWWFIMYGCWVIFSPVRFCVISFYLFVLFINGIVFCDCFWLCCKSVYQWSVQVKTIFLHV